MIAIEEQDFSKEKSYLDSTIEKVCSEVSIAIFKFKVLSSNEIIQSKT